MGGPASQSPVEGLSVPLVFTQCLGAIHDALGSGLTAYGTTERWTDLTAVARLTSKD